jgi:hypothetical protein
MSRSSFVWRKICGKILRATPNHTEGTMLLEDGLLDAGAGWAAHAPTGPRR